MAYFVEFSAHNVPKYDIYLDPIPPGQSDFSNLDATDVVSADLLPKRAQLKTSRGSVPEVGRLLWYWCVGQRFRDLVEAREPGVHGFFPITILYKDGHAVEKSFYLFQIRRRIRAMIIERSNVDTSPIHPGLAMVKVYPFKVVLDKSKIADCQVWRGAEGCGHVYFSDDLFSSLKKEKLMRHILAYHTTDEMAPSA